MPRSRQWTRCNDYNSVLVKRALCIGVVISFIHGLLSVALWCAPTKLVCKCAGACDGQR